MPSERQRTAVAERRARVLRLRVAGMSWQAIAEEIDRSRKTAAAAGDREAGRRRPFTDKHAVMDCRRALAEVQSQLTDLASLHLALELERLDSLTRTAETLLAQSRQAGDRWQALRAIDRLLNIGKRRDELLGLSRTTSAAQDAAEAKGGNAAVDAVDELARVRAERASGR